MFDPILGNCLKESDFVAITADNDALNYGQSMVTQKSSKLWSYDVIAKDSRFGPNIADMINNSLIANGRQGAANLFCVQGIDLSLDQAQAGLDQLATAVPSLATACAALKLLGVWQVSVFTSRGVTWSPVVSDITFHRAANVAAANWQHVANDIMPLLLANGSNWSTMKAAITGVS